MNTLHSPFIGIDTKHTYESGVGLLYASARAFGLEPTKQKIDEWSALLVATKHIDTVIDGPDSELNIKPLIEAISNPNIYQDCPSKCPYCALNTHTSQWPEESRADLADVVRVVHDTARERRQTTSAKKLGLLALEDGYQASRLFNLSEGTTIRVANWKTWLERLLQAGTVIDHAFDLPEDFAASRTAVAPTIRNRGIIALAAAPHITQLAKRTPHGLYPIIWDMAKATLDS